MSEETLRELTSIEESLLDALAKVNPNLDEEEAAERIVDVFDALNKAPNFGLLLAKMAADKRVDAKAKIQLGLLTLNTVLWGPARFTSRLVTGPAGWFVGPISFFNDVVGMLYGAYRLAQVIDETGDDVLQELWDGDPADLDDVINAVREFNEWAEDKKIDKAFMVLSWIP